MLAFLVVTQRSIDILHTAAPMRPARDPLLTFDAHGRVQLFDSAQVLCYQARSVSGA